MRTYISKEFTYSNWEELEKYYTDLLARPIQSLADFQLWLSNRSELDAVVEEAMAWSYIRMTIDTTDEKANEAYTYFVTEIQPKIAPLEEKLNQKTIATPWITDLESDEAYHIYFRGIRTSIELFNEENIPLETEVQTLTQRYSSIIGKQTIQYKGEELTMPKAAVYLKNPNETVREEVYRLITERRLQDTEELNNLFSELVQLRDKIAINAGCTDFRAYKFKALGRFDYTIQDCVNFHSAIAELVVPMVKTLHQEQADKLGKLKLKPWDTEVDPMGLDALKPFEGGNELLENTVAIFNQIDTYFADCLTTMSKNGYLDLDSKPGKAPGGYNYPLYESGIPFIFMNAAGSQRDVVTMVHEGGHAVHSFLSRDLSLTGFKSLPSEVAELASMSMELMTMDNWSTFYSNENDLKRAKLEQLTSIIKVLPWIATIDAFQHWIYTHPNHTNSERAAHWKELSEKFGTGLIDTSDYPEALLSSWHKQLHLFEVPFYYIEYGIAQLGALGVWMNYKENPSKALQQYKDALRLGYTQSIPKVYATAGLKFDFSSENMSNLMHFVQEEINLLN